MSSRIYAVPLAHVMTSWLCDVRLSLVTPKDQALGDPYLLLLFPGTPSKNPKQKKISEAFSRIKKKKFNVYLCPLKCRSQNAVTNVFLFLKYVFLIGLEFWTHVGPSGKFSGTSSNSYITPLRTPSFSFKANQCLHNTAIQLLNYLEFTTHFQIALLDLILITTRGDLLTMNIMNKPKILL